MLLSDHRPHAQLGQVSASPLQDDAQGPGNWLVHERSLPAVLLSDTRILSSAKLRGCAACMRGIAAARAQQECGFRFGLARKLRCQQQTGASLGEQLARQWAGGQASECEVCGCPDWAVRHRAGVAMLQLSVDTAGPENREFDARWDVDQNTVLLLQRATFLAKRKVVTGSPTSLDSREVGHCRRQNCVGKIWGSQAKGGRQCIR